MVEVLLAVAAIAGFFIVARLSRRVEDIERRQGLAEQSTDVSATEPGREIRALQDRVSRLEAVATPPRTDMRQETSHPPASAPSHQPAPAPSHHLPVVPRTDSRQEASHHLPVGPRTDSRQEASHHLPVGPRTDSRQEVSHQPAPAPPSPSLAARQMERMRKELQQEGWEALVGGSWLNKLGVLVTVIGIALFLGYSLTELGPLGRVALGLAASLALLGTGVVFERRPRFVMFGRGLIGGGWAGTYFTTYAMHGLDAARIIENAVVGSAALTAVAVAMIAHSLRYRSQVVTSLAYFVGFATLAIAPVTNFTLAATVPLAVSLLWLSHRSAWPNMAVVGLLTTYGTFLITRAGVGDLSTSSFVREQSVLALYWLLFEGFDVLSARAGRRNEPVLPLNACALVGVSLLRWSSFTPERLYVLFGIATAAYVMSTIVRALVLRPASALDGAEPVPDTSYRWSVTAAVALVVPAILLRFTGMQVNLAFLLAGEMLFLSGLRFGDVYLRWLAACLLAVAVLKVPLFDIHEPARFVFGTWSLLSWTPVAVIMAAVLYLNRALVGEKTSVTPETGYRVAASAFLVLVIGAEAGSAYVGVGWLVLAAALFEAGVGRRIAEFRFHGYVIGAAALLAMTAWDLNPVAPAPWLHPALHATLTYLALARIALARRGRLDETEGHVAFTLCSWFGALFAATVVLRLVPVSYQGPSWLLLSGVLFELGLRTRTADFRHQSYVVGAGALLVMAASDLNPLAPGWFHPLLHASLTYFALARIALARRGTLDEAEGRALFTLCSWFGALFAATVVLRLVPVSYLGSSWLLLSGVLFELGLRTRTAEFRHQSYVVGVAGLATLAVDAFPATVDATGLLTSLGTGALLLAAGFTRVWLLRGADRVSGTERSALLDVSAGGVVALLGVLSWQLLPTPVVAMAWGAMGIVLIDLGPTLGVASLTLYGHLAMAGMCGRLLMANLTSAGTTFGISHRLLTMTPAAALLYLVSSWTHRIDGAPRWDADLWRVYRWTGTAALVILIAFEFGRTSSVAGWAVLSAALVALGLLRTDADFRLQGYAVGLLTFVRSWATSLYVPDSFSRDLDRLILAAVVIGAFHTAQVLMRRGTATWRAASDNPGAAWGPWLDAHAGAAFSIAATLLLAQTLYNETSAGLLTVAWGLQGAVLLGVGFLARDRTLRRSGLLLLAVCTVKAFAYDFRVLDTLSRILSFIVLGLLMLLTSWVYVRYRERLRQYL